MRASLVAPQRTQNASLLLLRKQNLSLSLSPDPSPIPLLLPSSPPMPSSLLAPAQSRAAAALLALALGQAQLDHSRPRNSAADDGGGGGGGDPSDLWTHESHALLRPVFHHLGIDPDSWAAIEETAASSCPRDRIAEVCRGECSS